MISDKKVAFHISDNRTMPEDTSSVRFGGIDEALIPKKHQLVNVPTLSNDSWMITIWSIDYVNIHILSRKTKGLINPGYPYIAAPKQEFEAFQD